MFKGPAIEGPAKIADSESYKQAADRVAHVDRDMAASHDMAAGHKMAAGGEAIRAQGITVRHGRRVILDVGDLRIGHGEAVAIIGPNGAGKSTLLHVLSFLIRPTTGSVFFNGTSPKTQRELLAARRRIAVVFQEPLLIDAPVAENVALGMRFRGLERGKIERNVAYWMDVFGIQGLARERAHTLSGGEAKRVSLARAFALEPDVLFLDEPFSALDIPTRQVLLAELARIIKAVGVTTVFVTHDYTEIMPLAPRTVAMVEGRVIRDGASEDILGDLGTLFTSNGCRVTAPAMMA